MTEIEKKEIEEMASIMCGHKRTCQDCLRECTRFGFAFDCECLLFAEKVYKKGYRKQSEVLKDFIKQIEKKFGKSCSEEYQFTFIEMLSTDLEELAEKYGKEVSNAKN